MIQVEFLRVNPVQRPGAAWEQMAMVRLDGAPEEGDEVAVEGKAVGKVIKRRWVLRSDGPHRMIAYTDSNPKDDPKPKGSQ